MCLFNTGLKCCDNDVSSITRIVLIKLQHNSSKINHEGENWVLMGNFTLFTMTPAISSKNEIILPGKGVSFQTVHFTILVCIASIHVLEIPQ